MRYLIPTSFLVIVALSSPLFGQDTASIQKLIDKRREALPHVEVKFHVKETFEPGAWLSEEMRAKKDVKLRPETKQEYEFDNRYVLSKEGCRYENHTPMRDTGAGKLTPFHYIATTNYKLGKALFPNGFGRDGKPHGSIFLERNDMLQGSLEYPITFNLGLGDRMICDLPLELYQPTGKSEIIRDMKCQEYQRYDSRSEGTDSLWISDDAYLLKSAWVKKGQILYLIEVEYEWNGKAKQKLPKSWVNEHFAADGTKASRCELTVTSWNFEPVDPSEFDIVFPVGTSVSEIRTHGKEYIIREDGQMQMVLSHNGKGTSHIFPQSATEIPDPPLPYWLYYVLPYWWVIFPVALVIYLVYRLCRFAVRRLRKWKAKVQPA